MTGKQRIAIVVPNLMIGGTERHLLAVLPRLVAHGFAVHVLTTRGEAALDAAFIDQGVSVHHPGRLSRFGKLGVLLSLALTLRRLKPDVAHFYLAEAYLLGSLAALLARVPVRIMSRRSQNHYQKKYPVLSRLERIAHKQMQATLGNSAAVCAELAQEGVPPQRLGLIANGVDTQRFAPGDARAARAVLGLPIEGFVMVMVANLIAYKGHDDLIEALAGIADELPSDWTLLCVGRDEGIGATLRQQAEKRGIAGHIRWVGEQPAVITWLNAADLALLSSHEEGSPNSVIEALAAGLPIVATDVGGVSDILGDAESGFCVPPKNPSLFAARVLELANDEPRRSAMGKAARDRAETRFALERCVDAYAALYSALYCDPDHRLAESLRFPLSATPSP